MTGSKNHPDTHRTRKPRVPSDVGQVANLRGGWLPPPVRCECGSGPIDNRPQLTKLPHIAASRKRCWRSSEGRSGASKGGRRIANPPQVNNPMPLVFPNTCHSELVVGRAIVPAAAF